MPSPLSSAARKVKGMTTIDETMPDDPGEQLDAEDPPPGAADELRGAAHRLQDALLLQHQSRRGEGEADHQPECDDSGADAAEDGERDTPVGVPKTATRMPGSVPTRTIPAAMTEQQQRSDRGA